MYSLNPDKNFNESNHPFNLGLKGHCYQTFTEYSGRAGYQLSVTKKIEGVLTTTLLGSRPSYTDGFGECLPTTAAEKINYFSGRVINSFFSVPTHAVRTSVDISLQGVQTLAFVSELCYAKIASKYSTSYECSYPMSGSIAEIRNSSGCCGAINDLAERLFLIGKYTRIKSFSSIIRRALTQDT